MRSVIHHFIVVAMVGCTIASGCAAHRTGSEAPRLWHNSAFHPTVPKNLFDSYETAFKYIALREGLADDRHTLIALAADSTLERSHSHLTGDLVVVRAEYYGKSRLGIRGAQGQGRYYAFQIRDNGWKLVGIFHGNSYRWDAVGDTLRVITRWHMSASESPETVYTWRGELFE